MDFNKREWQDREVEFPNRRIITDIDSGETQNVNITKDEGDVIVPGDVLNATNMNDLEDRIANSVNSKSSVAVKQVQSYGNKVAEITVDGETTNLYAPPGSGGGGGGSVVEVTALQTSGTNIAKIKVDAVTTDLYAPKTEVTQVLSTGTKIATISVDGSSTDLFAPQGGGGGSDKVFNAILAVSQEIPDTQYNEDQDAYLMYFDRQETYEEINDTKSILNYYSYTYDTWDSLWLIVTTYSADNYFEITQSGESDPLLVKSGLMTNELVFLPGTCVFTIYHDSANPPSVKSPGGHLVYTAS